MAFKRFWIPSLCALITCQQFLMSHGQPEESAKLIPFTDLAQSVHVIGRTGLRHGQLMTISGHWRRESVLRGSPFYFVINEINGVPLQDPIEFSRDDIQCIEEVRPEVNPVDRQNGIYYVFETGGFYGVPNKYLVDMNETLRKQKIDVPLRSGRFEMQCQYSYQTR